MRYVEAAGRHGSIAAAALEQNISQSSITAAIDALENQLGHDLFVRTPAKGIRSTPSGGETLTLIRNFLDQSKHFESDIKSVGGRTTGSLRIACYATAAPSFLPPILTSLKEKYPGVSITLLEGDMQTIMEYLERGAADIAFTYNQTVDERHMFRPLFGAPPYAIFSSDDPLAKLDVVTFEQLCPLPMILLDLPQTRDYFVRMFQDRGLTPNIAHSTRSTEIVRALVNSGYGYSILNIRPPDYRENMNKYVVCPIAGDVLVPEFGIATQAAVRQSKMVQSVIDHCMALRDSGVFDPLIVT